jgi:hypothetical protein
MAHRRTEMHQLLAPADYRRVPWKNGGGHTLEIAADPPGSTVAGFAWRVSVADVDRDGPFSAFPGVDRTLVLLGGNGMRLTGACEPLELHTAYEPVRFAGEAALHCALVAGPTRDFNLMVRRDAAAGDVVVVRDAACAVEPARAYVCFAAAGACECLLAGYPPLVVAPEHALVVRGEPTAPVPGIHVYPTSGTSVALVAVIRAPRVPQ